MLGLKLRPGSLEVGSVVASRSGRLAKENSTQRERLRSRLRVSPTSESVMPPVLSSKPWQGWPYICSNRRLRILRREAKKMACQKGKSRVSPNNFVARHNAGKRSW